MLKISQYPQNADGTPMDLEVGVLTDVSGNGGQRFIPQPVGPDNAPIDNKGLILVTKDGDPFVDTDGTMAGNSDLRVPSQKAFLTFITSLLATVSRVAVNRVALSNAAFGSVPVYLMEAGRRGWFVQQNGDYSALITADTAQTLSVAASDNLTGDQKAWIRQFDGPVISSWCGLAAGDVQANGAINTPAFKALLNAMSVAGYTYLQSSPGIYWWADNGLGAAIDITFSNVIFQGAGGGGQSRTASVDTIFKFPAGITGIRIQGAQTSGALTKDAAPHADARGTVLRNLVLLGGFDGTHEGEFHGVHVRTMATLENLTIENFQGDGVYISAQLASGDGVDPPYGNANNCVLSNLNVIGTRDGIHINGNDANATLITRPVPFTVRRWGINDQSEFGSTVIDMVATACGCLAVNDGVILGASLCSQGGNVYFAIDGQEAGASVNAPTGAATDNQWWAYLQPGGPAAGIPAWFNGMLVRAGGPVRDTSTVGAGHYDGCYVEGGQAKSQIRNPSFVAGGLMAQAVFNSTVAAQPSGAFVRAGLDNSNTDTCVIAGPVFKNISGLVATQLGGALGNSGLVALDINHTPGTLGRHTVNFSTGLGNIIWGRFGGAQSTFQITTVGTASFFGTGAALPDAFNPLTLIVTDNGRSFANGRRIMIDTAAPASVAHGQGEWCFFRGSNPNNQIGWNCTVAGTPGTWIALYALSAPAAAIATSGSGADLVAASVTYAKVQNVTSQRLLGNPTGGAAAPSEISLAGGLIFSGTTLSAAGNLTPTSVASTGLVTSSSATAGMGYATGAGGTVAQITSKATAVTLNKVCGQFTTNNAALAAAAVVSFQVNDTAIAATDTINLNLQSGPATLGTYRYWIEKVAAGSFTVTIENRSAGSLSEALVFNYAAIKAVAA
jgi:hypothetical protein